MPASMYSTGSSTVMILRSGRLMKLRHGVEGGGLAGAGGPGDEQDAVRQADQPLEGLLVVGEEAQLGQTRAAGFPCPEYA